ncbi:MAG: hypothetical protein PUB00_04030 [Clostridiales bacterium]|nr:hypothetical protein [Clostridiales bacterium]
MAAHYTEARILNTTFTPLQALLKDPVFCQILNLKFQSEILNGSNIWYCFDHGVTFSSWGEKITLSLTPIPQGQTRVDVSSECRMPTQIIDWGINKQNTTAIFNYIISYLPHYQAALSTVPTQSAVSAPTETACQSPTSSSVPNTTASSANQKYCICCGTLLASDAKFCIKCGSKQPCCDPSPQNE